MENSQQLKPCHSSKMMQTKKKHRHSLESNDTVTKLNIVTSWVTTLEHSDIRQSNELQIPHELFMIIGNLL